MVFTLSNKFAKSWVRREEPSLATKIKEAVSPPGPMRSRLDAVIKRVETQIKKLDHTSDRFSERDKSIFNRIVDAYTTHDVARANILASELAEIRKMEKMMLHARLALEQIALRMRTITELGDIAVTLTPVVGVIHGIKGGMSTVSPRAEKELGDIASLLTGIVADAGQVAGKTIDFEMINEDSKNILKEASIVAEQRMKDKFPELPTLTQPSDEEIHM